MAAPSKRLSAEGQALVADFRGVVEQAKYLLLTKNEGNLLQVSAETAKQHGKQAKDGLRTLGTLLISNGQFRKLCK